MPQRATRGGSLTSERDSGRRPRAQFVHRHARGSGGSSVKEEGGRAFGHAPCPLDHCPTHAPCSTVPRAGQEQNQTFFRAICTARPRPLFFALYGHFTSPFAHFSCVSSVFWPSFGWSYRTAFLCFVSVASGHPCVSCLPGRGRSTRDSPRPCFRALLVALWTARDRARARNGRRRPCRRRLSAPPVVGRLAVRWPSRQRAFADSASIAYFRCCVRRAAVVAALAN